MPRTARVIAAHNVPVLLHEQCVRTRRMQRDPMHAVTDFRIRIRDILRAQSAVDWVPCVSAIVSAKRAGGGDRDGNSLGVGRIEKNGMQTHPARARLPFWSRIVATQAGEFLPRFSAVC